MPPSPLAPTPASQASLFGPQGDLQGLLLPCLYTPLVWGFELPPSAAAAGQEAEEAAVRRAVAVLTAGLTRLSELCPYLAAQIVAKAVPIVVGNNSGADATSPSSSTAGGFEWAYYSRYRRTIPLTVVDLRSSALAEDAAEWLPSLAELKATGFPVSMLDGGLLFSDLHGIPSLRDPAAPRAVVVAQLTIIDGGLIFGLAGEHSVMDGGGLAAVLSLLDRLCNDAAAAMEGPSNNNASAAAGVSFPTSITAEDPLVRTINMDRRGAVVPFPPNSTDASGAPCYVAGEELLNLTPAPQPPAAAATVAEDSRPPMWTIFHFSAEAQLLLKEAVSQHISTLPNPNGDGASTKAFVSTNDVVTAFLWQRILRARRQRLGSEADATTFGRAVDVRSVVAPRVLSPPPKADVGGAQWEAADCALPATYPGNMTLHTYSTMGLVALTTEDDEDEAAAKGDGYVKGLAAASLLLRADLARDRSPSSANGFAAQLRSLAALLLQHQRRHVAYAEAVSGASGAAIAADAPPAHVGVYPGARLQITGRDLIFSSWAALPCYAMRFGLVTADEGGYAAPLAVRRPNFAPVEGLLYLLPANTNVLSAAGGDTAAANGAGLCGGGGSIDALLSLSAADVDRLRGDALFCRYAQWIG